MAIDLCSMSLASDAKEAVLYKPNSAQKSYRLNTEKIKEDFETIKANSKNLLKQGNVSEDNIYEIHTGTIDRTVNINYTAEVFFQKQEPAIVREDGTYNIMGVGFTEKEMKESRMVLQTAANSIGAGIGKNGNLDYKNYAQMGIALSAVKSYAASLSEEQGAVVINAMEQYNEGLVNMEKELLSSENYVPTDYEGLSEYYGMGYRIDNVEPFNDLIDEMNRLSGGDRKHIEPGRLSTVQSATNSELISSITNLFSDLDIKNSGQLNSAFSRYKDMLAPAYSAMGLSEKDGSIEKVLNEDINYFQNQLKDIMAAVSYRSINFTV